MRIYPQLSGPRSSQILRDVLVAGAVLLCAVGAWLVRRAVMSLTAISTGFTDSAQSAKDTWDSVGQALSGVPLVGDSLGQTVSGLSAATFGNAATTGATITAAVTTAATVLALVTFAAPVSVLAVVWLPRRIDRARRWDAAERVLSAVAVSPTFGAAVDPAHAVSAAPATALPRTDPAGALPRADAIGVEPPSTGLVRPDDGTGSVAPVDGHDTVALPLASAPPAGFRDVQLTATGPREVSFPPDELLALRALCHLPFTDLVRFTPRPFEAFAAGDYAPLVAALYAHEGLIPPGWSPEA